MRQREQAEQIRIVPRLVDLPKPAEGEETEISKMYGGDKRAGSCQVANDSARPIRRVRCRLALDECTIPADEFELCADFPIPFLIGSRTKVFSGPDRGF